MKRKTYFLNGKECSVSELCRISGISRHYMDERLRAGWSAEKAVSVPAHIRVSDMEHPFENSILIIQFAQKIPGVFPQMQPKLGVTYTAFPHTGERYDSKSRPYYIIELDNMKPLIVYPGEFQVICVKDSV